jgi:hypothetical protein
MTSGYLALHELKKRQERNISPGSTGTDGYLHGKRLMWFHAVGGKKRWNSTQITLRTVKGVSFDIVNNEAEKKNVGLALESLSH